MQHFHVMCYFDHDDLFGNFQYPGSISRIYIGDWRTTLFCLRIVTFQDRLGHKITRLAVFSAFLAVLSGAFPELLVVEAELEAVHVLQETCINPTSTSIFCRNLRRQAFFERLPNYIYTEPPSGEFGPWEVSCRRRQTAFLHGKHFYVSNPICNVHSSKHGCHLCRLRIARALRLHWCALRSIPHACRLRRTRALRSIDHVRKRQEC